MVFTEGFPWNFERAFEEWVRVVVLALIGQQIGETVEPFRRIVCAAEVRTLGPLSGGSQRRRSSVDGERSNRQGVLDGLLFALLLEEIEDPIVRAASS